MICIGEELGDGSWGRGGGGVGCEEETEISKCSKVSQRVLK